MDRDEAKRTEIEDRIIAFVTAIQIRERSAEGVYIDLDKLDDFVDVCSNLSAYFQEYADTTIGVEIIRIYADLTRYFRYLSENTPDETVRENAQEWLDEIEGWMDDIISEAAKNWGTLNSGE